MYRPLSLYAPVTINNNFKSRPERLKLIHLLYFSLSGLDLKLLFFVTGAYNESGLLHLEPNIEDVITVPNHIHEKLTWFWLAESSAIIL